jgi:signal transduction histidine kinase
MPLRTQIFIYFLTVTAIAVLVVSFFHYRTAKQARLQEAYNHMESLSEAKKLRMQGIIRLRKEQIIMLQLREHMIDNLDTYQTTKSPSKLADLAFTLKNINAEIPSFKEISLLSMDGIVQVSTSEAMQGEDYSQHESFVHGLKGELCLHDFFFDTDNSLYINMGGILKKGDKNVGVIVIKSKADDILTLINDYTGLGNTGETVLAKELGDKIFFMTSTRFHDIQSDSLLLDSNVSVPMKLALIGKEQLFTDALDYRQEPVIASTRYLKEVGWGMVTKIDKKEVWEPLNFILYQTMLLGILLTAAVAIAAHFLARIITRPILMLRDTSHEIANNNLDKRINYISKNEVGQLAYTFNLMADRLAESYKKLEEKVEEKERINDSLNRFAHVVAHDLKSPLFAINALIAALHEELENHPSQDVQQMLKMAEGKSKHMLDLINGILQYSISSMAQEEREPVELSSLVHNIVNQLEVPAHIQVNVEQLPTIIVERVLILQVFQNLLSNAIKYLDKPTGCIVVGSSINEGEVTFFVRDNGRGIDDKYFEKIFDIFNKTHNIKGVDSTGIGLSIVKKIIESKGGRVWLTSEIGVGSTFYFTLPKEDLQVQVTV